MSCPNCRDAFKAPATWYYGVGSKCALCGRKMNKPTTLQNCVTAKISGLQTELGNLSNLFPNTLAWEGQYILCKGLMQDLDDLVKLAYKKPEPLELKLRKATNEQVPDYLRPPCPEQPREEAEGSPATDEGDFGTGAGVGV